MWQLKPLRCTATARPRGWSLWAASDSRSETEQSAAGRANTAAAGSLCLGLFHFRLALERARQQPAAPQQTKRVMATLLVLSAAQRAAARARALARGPPRHRPPPRARERTRVTPAWASNSNVPPLSPRPTSRVVVGVSACAAAHECTTPLHVPRPRPAVRRARVSPRPAARHAHCTTPTRLALRYGRSARPQPAGRPAGG
jgi:hypothetical protein